MIYTRLDGKCKAKVLAVTDDRVLLIARWPASKNDERKHSISNGIAQNVTTVTPAYFERKYGQVAEVSA